MCDYLVSSHSLIILLRGFKFLNTILFSLRQKQEDLSESKVSLDYTEKSQASQVLPTLVKIKS